ncbi:exocyst complex component exo84, partial [Linderina pennispora]
MDTMSRKKSMRRTMTVAPRAMLDAKPAADAQQAEVPNVVLSELVASNFKPEDYLKRTLKAVPEKSIRQFRKALEDSRKLTARNLQKNVYRNYESFVFISKEISGMERDMQLLRELLHNISQVGDDLIEEETEENLGRRRTLRMSMANQQDMFKEQLAKVWRSVQDAQRFVPFAPNRH